MCKITEAYRKFTHLFQGIFPNSANVDIMHCLLNLKPAMRTRVISPQLQTSVLERWCSDNNFLTKRVDVNIYDFVYIARERHIIEEILRVDGSCEPHEKPLGTLLNYPECCIEKISKVGELNIDDFERRLIDSSFQQSFQLINPSDYIAGAAFISHVPCSTTCIPSLQVAIRFADYIFAHRDEIAFEPWLKKLDMIDYSLLKTMHNCLPP